MTKSTNSITKQLLPQVQASLWASTQGPQNSVHTEGMHSDADKQRKWTSVSRVRLRVNSLHCSAQQRAHQHHTEPLSTLCGFILVGLQLQGGLSGGLHQGCKSDSRPQSYAERWIGWLPASSQSQCMASSKPLEIWMPEAMCALLEAVIPLRLSPLQ